MLWSISDLKEGRYVALRAANIADYHDLSSGIPYDCIPDYLYLELYDYFWVIDTEDIEI